MIAAMLDQLLEVLTPTACGDGAFLGLNMHPRAQRVYGGQVLAQALHAAIATVPEDRSVHSQHAYFLRPGDPGEPIRFEVEQALDGGSLSSRRVVARQRDKPILVSSLSFLKHARGETYQTPMPVAPAPGSLPTEREREQASGIFNEDFMIITGTDLDVRVVDPVDWLQPRPREPKLMAWMKTSAPLPATPSVHQAVLAYMSDAFLIDVCLIANGQSFLQEDLQIASLDHALWIHHPVLADEWLLHAVEAECVSGGKGLARGSFYNTSGVLVASTVQQALMRYR